MKKMFCLTLAVLTVFVSGAASADTSYALQPWKAKPEQGMHLAAGSCPGGSCPAPGAFGSFGGAQVPETTPLPDEGRYYSTQFEATVRVVAHEGRLTSLGTGVIVHYVGHRIVVTARHVVKATEKAIIRTYRGKQVSMVVLDRDPAWDVAVLVPETDQDIAVFEQLSAVEFPDERDPRNVLKPGMPVYFIGYAASETPSLFRGRFREFHYGTAGRGAADWLAVTPQAREGDSGGPIFDASGKLVGILWGAGQGETVGTQYGRVETFLQTCLGGGRIARRPRQPAPSPPSAPSPAPPQPQQPEKPSGAPTPPAPEKAGINPLWIAFPPLLVLIAAAAYGVARIATVVRSAAKQRG